MKKKAVQRGIKKSLAAGAVVLAGALPSAQAQYTPPASPAPFPGFLNEYLRANDPSLTPWDFGGVERLRAVDYDGYAIPGVAGSMDFRAHGPEESDSYVLSRLRYHVGYTDDWWNAYVEGQSSLVAGDDRFAYADNPTIPGTVKVHYNGPESDTFDLHQGYLLLGDLKQFPVSITVGRQELIYGEERLLGGFGWNNISRSFDAARVRWQNSWFSADFFTGHPVIPTDGKFDVSNQQDWLSGVYATLNGVPKNVTELYLLARNASREAANYDASPEFPQPNAQDVYTVGGRLKSKPGELGHWDYSLEGAYQFGDFATSYTGKRLTQDAYMFIAQGGYTFQDWWATPRLGLEYNYASGDDNASDGTHGTFVNLFPTNHKFFGSMDLISLQNIEDVGTLLNLKPLPTVSCALEGYAFWLADTHDSFYNVTGAPRTGGTVGAGNGYAINPGYSSFVGSQISAYAGWAATRYLQLESGIGHFFAGDYIRESLSNPAYGHQDANFVYAQASLKF